MFWWTWSKRRRIAVLALLGAPLVCGIALVLLQQAPTPVEQATSTTVAPTTVSSPATVTPTPTEIGLLTPIRYKKSDPTRPEQFLPKAFGHLSGKSLTPLVLPQHPESGLSIYRFSDQADIAKESEVWESSFRDMGAIVNVARSNRSIVLTASGSEGDYDFKAEITFLQSDGGTAIAGTVVLTEASSG